MCDNCLENCGQNFSTDKCVKYTGPNIDTIGICNGMALYEVEQIIFTKLQQATDTTVVSLGALTTTCTAIVNMLNGYTQPLSLQNFAEIVFKGFCTVNSQITTINSQLPVSFSFNTACLTGDTTSRDKILQAAILKLCSVDSRTTIVEGAYVKQSDLLTQVTTIIAATISTQFNSRMVPYAPIPYEGPLTNFDNTGKGLSSYGFDKIYLCNGLNGTRDWRGRSPIGAILNVPGGTMDANVDPSVNPLNNYSLGQKFGTSSDILNISQLPNHTHSATDAGHTHDLFTTGYLDKGAGDGANVIGSQPGSSNKTSKVSYANISVASTGSSQAHNTVHPVIGVYYIVYIP